MCTHGSSFSTEQAFKFLIFKNSELAYKKTRE